MAMKRYHVNVIIDLVDYFENKLSERADKINIIKKDEVPQTAENGKQYIYYILEAEEGVIDPKYELKDEES